MPEEIATYADGEIDRVLTFRVCARCYGDLTKFPADGRMWQAKCLACGETWHGTTISRLTAEKMGQKALADYRDVRETLREFFPRAKKSVGENLAELGF